jgi:outer membrane protein assembly factor BamD (BamD/ComL family)
MKNGLWIIALTMLMVGCKKVSEDDKASALISQIESLYEKGEYKTTLDSIESLRSQFPRAINSRKRALVIWQNASLKMAQVDIAQTDSALQTTIHQMNKEGNIYKRNMLGVKRDSLKARYEAMCGVVRMIHMRQKQN